MWVVGRQLAWLRMSGGWQRPQHAARELKLAQLSSRLFRGLCAPGETSPAAPIASERLRY